MYAKLFSRIAQSSLMEEKVTTRYVFMMMLAIADRHGDVIGTDIAIARTINVTLDEFVNAITPLLSPDPASNSQAEEGRRLIPSENGRGYRVVNYPAYRDMKSDDEKREYMRNYMRQRRASKGDVKSVKICKPPLNDVTHTDTDTEANTESKPTPNPAAGGRERKSSDNLPTAPESIKISELFHRRPTTKWSAKEITAYKAIPREALEDLDLVCQYTESERAKGQNGRHRRDLLTFLNNFTGELDRARAKPINSNGKTTSAAQYGI